MVHVGSTGELEYAVVPLVRSGEVMELVYAVHAGTGGGVARTDHRDVPVPHRLLVAVPRGGGAGRRHRARRGALARARHDAATAGHGGRGASDGDRRLLSAGAHALARRGRTARDGVQPDERRAAGPRAVPSRPARERVPRAQDADHRDPRAPGEPAGRRGAAGSRDAAGDADADGTAGTADRAAAGALATGVGRAAAAARGDAARAARDPGAVRDRGRALRPRRGRRERSCPPTCRPSTPTASVSIRSCSTSSTTRCGSPRREGP